MSISRVEIGTPQCRKPVARSRRGNELSDLDSSQPWAMASAWAMASVPSAGTLHDSLLTQNSLYHYSGSHGF